MLNGARLRQTLGGTMGRTPDKKNFGRIWPNGNFSLGVGPVGTAALEMDGKDEESLARWGDHPGLGAAIAAFTSSNAPKSDTECPDRPKRGLQGITGHGQQMLRSACYLLERDYGNADLCFATLTVPTLSRQGRLTLARNWSLLVNQLTKWVCRRLMRAGRPTKVAGCVEIQTARLANRGEGYLHLHVVWPSHANGGGRCWAVNWAEMRDWWGKALERFSGETLPHHPRVELSAVKKSAEKYMGKYLSKGSGESLDEFISDLGVEAVPSQWWFMSAEMRDQVKAAIAHGPNTGEVLRAVMQTAFESGDFTMFEWVRHVEVVFADRPVTIGWCGRLRPEVRDDLLSLLAPLTVGV